jgi:hypothetical protein
MASELAKPGMSGWTDGLQDFNIAGRAAKQSAANLRPPEAPSLVLARKASGMKPQDVAGRIRLEHKWKDPGD